MVQDQGAASGVLKVLSDAGLQAFASNALMALPFLFSQEGDKILSINGQSTDRKSHDEVVGMLRGSDDAIVLMQVRDTVQIIAFRFVT